MKTPEPRWKRGLRVLFIASFPLLVLMSSVSWAQGGSPVIIPLKKVTGATFSPDGRHLAVLIKGEHFVSNAGSVFDARTGALEARLQVPTPGASLMSLVWAPDSSRFATAYKTFTQGLMIYKYRGRSQRNLLNYVALWDARSGAQTRVFPYAPFYEYAFGYLNWARDGKLWGNGTPPALFEVKTGQRLRRFGPLIAPGESEWNTYNSDHTLLAISRKSTGEVWVYEVPGGRLVRKWGEKKGTSAFWGRNEDVLLLSCQGEGKPKNDAPQNVTVRLREARTGRILAMPPLGKVGPWGFVRQGRIAFIDTKQRFNRQGTVKSESWRLLVWDYRTKKVLWQIAHPGRTYRFPFLSISPDGRRISALDQRQKLSRVVWDATTGKEIWRREVKPTEQKMTWAPDSKRLAIYGGDKIEIVRVSG